MSRKRNTYLKNQINQRLNELDRIGQSKKQAKIELKKSPNFKFGDTPEGIYSIKTKDNYRQVLKEFSDYCIEKGESTRADLQKLIDKYGLEYLKDREEKGLSVYTLGRDRAALNKCSTSETKIKLKFNKRDVLDIKRSRNDLNAKNKHFSEERNKELVAFAKGTGGRRDDLKKLTPESFYEKNGRLYCRFEQSKGGRSRTVLVREEYQDIIKNKIEMTRSNETIFERIHKHADIHSYRRDYAQNLYKDIIKDNDLKNDLTALYGERNENNVKSDYYITKGQDSNFKGLRDDIHIITNALGHTRLEVAVNHYLR